MPPVSTLRVGELPVSATEGRQQVDMALDAKSWSRAAVVDEGGAVWLWWEEKERLDGRQDGRLYKSPKLYAQLLLSQLLTTKSQTTECCGI